MARANPKNEPTKKSSAEAKASKPPLPKQVPKKDDDVPDLILRPGNSDYNSDDDDLDDDKDDLHLDQDPDQSNPSMPKNTSGPTNDLTARFYRPKLTGASPELQILDIRSGYLHLDCNEGFHTSMKHSSGK